MSASAQPEVVVITGMSGAGRSTASNVLEDLGYFVIDNMPPELLERVMELVTAAGSTIERVALVVDVRGRPLWGDVQPHLRALRERGVALRLLFLEADDETLVTRYETARRRHPMAPAGRMIDGIRSERALLTDLRAEADLIIDTSATNVHELRARVSDAFGEHSRAMVVNLLSFGFKHGTPRDADMVLDVRFLPNPHWVDDLRPLTGRDREVADYVFAQPMTTEFLDRLYALFDVMVPGFIADGKRYLTIAVGCTGGRHRSVALAEHMGGYLQRFDVAVQVEHRDAEL
ncbi:MAG: RNase adapter RapZ [Actinobacteria bacterium]|nr:RNase adapter RapZ [Actinomycetota bacterium]